MNNCLGDTRFQPVASVAAFGFFTSQAVAYSRDAIASEAFLNARVDILHVEICQAVLAVASHDADVAHFFHAVEAFIADLQGSPVNGGAFCAKGILRAGSHHGENHRCCSCQCQQCKNGFGFHVIYSRKQSCMTAAFPGEVERGVAA